MAGQILIWLVIFACEVKLAGDTRRMLQIVTKTDYTPPQSAKAIDFTGDRA